MRIPPLLPATVLCVGRGVQRRVLSSHFLGEGMNEHDIDCNETLQRSRLGNLLDVASNNR